MAITVVVNDGLVVDVTPPAENVITVETGSTATAANIRTAVPNLVEVASPANADMIQRVGDSWVTRTIAQIKTALGLGSAAYTASSAYATAAQGATADAAETPAGAQAKADAKVADAINNGTTTVAPSQNAVYDALDGKASLLRSGADITNGGRYIYLGGSTFNGTVTQEATIEADTRIYNASNIAIELESTALNDSVQILPGHFLDFYMTNGGGGAYEFQVSYNGLIIPNGTVTNAMLANSAVANLSGTNTGDQTSIVGITGTTAQFNTALTDGDFATLAGSETLTNKTIDAPTVSGAAQFTSTTRPTSSGTGTPAVTSLITFADAKTYFPEKQVKVSTSQMDVTSSTVNVDVTGLTGFALDAATWYELTICGRVTCGASGGYKVELLSDQNLDITAAGSTADVSMQNTGGGLAGGFRYGVFGRQIQLNNRTAAATALAFNTRFIFKTGASAPTVKIQFAQNISNGTTSSLLSNAVCSILKLI